jgi:CRISPR-associated protein Csm2
MYEQRQYGRRDYGPRPGGADAAPQFDPQKDRIIKIMGGDARELNRYAEEKARHLVSGRDNEKLSTSQVRNVLDSLQRMNRYDEGKLQMLRPRLAYAAGRHKGRVRDLQAIMDIAIEMTDAGNFQNLKNLMEAIVAYHRYHGGK